MQNVLIADAGSSKTEWSLLRGNDAVPVRTKSEGINPAHESTDSIKQKLHSIKKHYADYPLSCIFFFGSGCSTDTLKKTVRSALSDIFHTDKIEVESDLIAAGKALFGDDKGIACIVGTGSNTGVYSEGTIIHKIPSLGFILGDEGSGVALGRALLNGVFKKQLSDVIIKNFEREYNLTVDRLINKVYGEPKPAQFIASFSPFLLKNIDAPEIRHLVISEFNNFIVKNVLPYKHFLTMKVGFIGSVAFNYREILHEVAKKYNIKISSIIKNPLPYLETYYSTI